MRMPLSSDSVCHLLWIERRSLAIFPLKFPLKSKKTTDIGRKGPRAKTRTVLKSVSQMQQLSSMQNSEFALCTIRITLLSAETNL